MELNYLRYGGAAVVICVLVYFKLLILAAAVTFATVWKHSKYFRNKGESSSSASTKKSENTSRSGSNSNPYGDAFWNDSHTADGEDGLYRGDFSRRSSENQRYPGWSDKEEAEKLGRAFTEEFRGTSSDFLQTDLGDRISDMDAFDFRRSQGGMGNFDRKGGKGDVMRQSNPRQVYVGGLPFKTEEGDLREFFVGNCGPIEQVKLLRQQDGKSKGVAFITFNNVEDAQKAIEFHDKDFEGRTLTVRIANPTGGKGEKNDKGDRNFDRGLDRNLDRGFDRVGAFYPSSSDKGRSGGHQTYMGGGGKGVFSRQDIDRLIQDVLADDLPLELADFDFQARRLLGELRSRDKVSGTTRCEDALKNVKQFCSTKDRSGVRNWKAYVYTLLSKQDVELVEELRERDRQERTSKGDQKGGGGLRNREPQQRVSE
eukprot:GEMP01018954.1.p1 GENE.GEMP01018954.1~~GEMP01018954.1.p1  ORF type:complete len:427 (-),score=88.59 GEMP01018954.1:1384-2664(-)